MKNKTVKKTESKGLLAFWIRMILWVIAQAGVPITVFAIKFGLFTTESITTSYDELGNVVQTSISLNGWGIVSVFLIGWTVMQIVNSIIESMEDGYSMVKQVVKGVKSRIIPLVITFFICYYLEGVLKEVMFCLIILIASQLVAIPLNPLPQWIYKKKGVEEYKDALTTLVDFIKTKKKQ